MKKDKNQYQKILHEYITYGNINSDVLEQLENEMNKNKVLEKHQYKITAPSKEGGRFMTYLFDTKKNRRQKVTAYTEQALYKKLYEFYFPTQKETLESLYPQWVEKRKNMKLSDRTIHRNRNDWEKYYRNKKIVNKAIDRITTEDIECFFYECIREHGLTKKALNNMKLIFKELMKLAKKKGLILVNPFDDIELNLNGCEPENNPKDISRIYLPEEKEKLFEYLMRRIQEHPEETDAYAVFLLFKLGLRIGEVAALKWCDVDWSRHEIHIRRMEGLEYDGTGKLRPVILEYTKKKSPYGNRFLPLSDYEIALLDKVKSINEEFGYSDNDFIFCDSNGRTKIREIDNCIRTQCLCANIPVKSAHDIRRTVASEMYNQGLSLEIIRQYLGHSNIQTTRGYILNNRSKQETNALIVNALSSMNGLHVLMGTQTVSNEKTSEPLF